MHGRVIGPGRETKVLEVHDPKAAARMQDALGRTTITLCYCSVLEECWRAVSGNHSSQVPVPVASCKGLPDGFQD